MPLQLLYIYAVFAIKTFSNFFLIRYDKLNVIFREFIYLAMIIYTLLS